MEAVVLHVLADAVEVVLAIVGASVMAHVVVLVALGVLVVVLVVLYS